MVAFDVKQNARMKWAVDGDENAKFFHGHVNSKGRKNRINGRMLNGRWSIEANEIKMEALQFFQNKFRESWVSRRKLINSSFKTLLMM